MLWQSSKANPILPETTDCIQSTDYLHTKPVYSLIWTALTLSRPFGTEFGERSPHTPSLAPVRTPSFATSTTADEPPLSGFVSGHGFSRAANMKRMRPLGPEQCFQKGNGLQCSSSLRKKQTHLRSLRRRSQSTHHHKANQSGDQSRE